MQLHTRVPKRSQAFPSVFLRSLFLTLFCALGLCRLSYADSLTINEGCFQNTAATVTVTAHINGNFAVAPPATIVNSFVIYVDGTARPTTSEFVPSGTGYIEAKCTVAINSNPQKLLCYARASLTNGTTTLLLDSRDQPNETDGSTGDGKVEDLIYSNIRLSTARWNNTPCNVLHVADRLIHPNVSQPYHFKDNHQGQYTDQFERYSAVYERKASPQITLKLTESLSPNVPVRVQLDVEAYPLPFYVAPQPTGYPFTKFAIIGGASSTFNFPALKDGIDKYSMRMGVNFDVQKSDGTWVPITGGYSQTFSLDVYAVLQKPVAPMDPPWDRVLDSTSKWGLNKSVSTAAAKAITEGMFLAPDLAYYYQIGTSWTLGSTPGGDDKVFKLMDFLTANTAGARKAMDCRDASLYLAICMASQGMKFTLRRFNSFTTHPTLVPGGFTSNLLCAMGSEPSIDTNYKPEDFDFHQVIFGNNLTYDSSNAHRYDFNGAEFRKPPALWNFSDYYQKSLTNPNRTVGLVAIPNPSVPRLFADHDAKIVMPPQPMF